MENGQKIRIYYSDPYNDPDQVRSYVIAEYVDYPLYLPFLRIGARAYKKACSRIPSGAAPAFKTRLLNMSDYVTIKIE